MHNLLILMVGEAGLEPATTGLEGRCSIQIELLAHAVFIVAALSFRCEVSG